MCKGSSVVQLSAFGLTLKLSKSKSVIGLKTFHKLAIIMSECGVFYRGLAALGSDDGTTINSVCFTVRLRNEEQQNLNQQRG